MAPLVTPGDRLPQVEGNGGAFELFNMDAKHAGRLMSPDTFALLSASAQRHTPSRPLLWLCLKQSGQLK